MNFHECLTDDNPNAAYIKFITEAGFSIFITAATHDQMLAMGFIAAPLVCTKTKNLSLLLLLLLLLLYSIHLLMSSLLLGSYTRDVKHATMGIP